MADTFRSPAELRSMFGANLRQLARRYPSVAALCRQLGINRTQFNRYLSGESFPRPDVLDRICRFFGVDARILLKPLDEIATAQDHPASETIDRFLAARTETPIEPGFYHAEETGTGLHRLFFVRQIRHCTLLRAYEPRPLMQETPAPRREIQGFVSHTNGQICALMSRRGGLDCRMMMATPTPDSPEPHWSGYMISLPRTAGAGADVQKLELRYLGRDLSAALRLARAMPHPPDHILAQM